MTTEKLTVWVQDLGLPEALAKHPIGSVQLYDWNWSNFHTALLKSLKQGTAPDLINFGTTYTGRLIRDGILLNITDFVTESSSISNSFFPRTLNSCRDPFQIDQYYALPLLADVRVLFYRVEFLEDYLREHPNAFKSWNTFEVMCQTLKKELPNRVIAWPLDHSAFHDLLPWVWASGGDFISVSNKVLLHSEYTKNALYRLARLILTDCTPIPPHPSFRTPDRVRTQFEIGNIAITSGTLWVDHSPNWRKNIKAVLHPASPFPSAFVGGTNLAIVRKYGGNTNNKAYEPAKTLLASLVDVDNQVTLAKSTGKLPCNILALDQMRDMAPDKEMRELLDTFNSALCHTIDRSMPALSNFVQIEEQLKATINTIWEEVGRIKTTHKTAPLDILEAKCKSMIDSELEYATQKIEKFVTNFAVQYTHKEVEDIGLTPPAQFDLWLKQTQDNPPHGIVYIANKGELKKGVGAKPYQLLLALINSPQRSLNQEELLELVWGFKASSDYKRMDEIMHIATQLPTLTDLLKLSFNLDSNHLYEKLKGLVSYLFDVDVHFIGNLNEGYLSEALLQKFRTQGKPLPIKNNTITKDRTGKRWLINSDGIEYLIQHEDEMLKVYTSNQAYWDSVNRLQQRNKWPNFRVYDFQSVVSSIINDYAENIAELSTISERKHALDTLRNTYRNLSKNLGKIRNKPIIWRSKQGAHYIYYLNKDISICLETS